MLTMASYFIYTHIFRIHTHTQSMDKHIPYEPSDKTRLKVQEIIRCLLTHSHRKSILNLWSLPMEPGLRREL